MKTRQFVSWSVAWIFLAVMNSFAQCYLSQGCKPVDFLNYQPNGTGQVYHGDGASNNGAGGWTTYYSDINQCLGCHYGTDTLPYLFTGHKNTLRKFAPGVLWGGPDHAPYLTTDDYYGSGSTYNWSTGQVTLGWCDPLGTLVQNGLEPTDPGCEYPFYTLYNAHAPAPYTIVPPTPAGGGMRNLFYLYGGWQNYGGSKNPSATHLNAVFDSGFTGDLYPQGNFDCARCHATGYNFTNYGPEPTANTNDILAPIPDTQFSRVPSDGYSASGPYGTSSWYLTGIQCERCHIAAYGWGSHPWDPVTVTVPHNEAATALCMECHRGEVIVQADPTANPPVPGSINPANALTTLDRGYCSDLSTATYATCLQNPSNQWIYKPYIDHEAGQAFLNSPHARFSGSLIQNAQHTADLSITLAGTYASQFSENRFDPTKNLGCTGCHDPHQSTVSEVNAPKPIVKDCTACHRLSSTIMTSINHPMGPGTPFPTGTSADIPGACITCHMQAALGQPTSHLFRISSDANYRTFPTPDQLHTQNLTSLGIAPEYSPLDGTTFNYANWVDVDLACGQCHMGGDGKTNPYGLTMPPGMDTAHNYTKTQLAYWASIMHPGDPAVPTPTFSPTPTTYHSPQNVTILDAMNGATIYYTTDGSMPNTNSPVYTTPIQIASSTTIRAIATYPGYPRSTVALGQYSIVLPTAPPPTFSPAPSIFTSPISVKLSNIANLSMYFTVDGSTPTTNSPLYTAPIAVTKNTTINAITAASGYLTSSVSSGYFQIQDPAPTFSPRSGTYYAAQTVVISDTNSGTTINYTTDGTIPTTSSASCANPCMLTIATTTTIKAIASGGGYATSSVSVATYTIAANTPTYSPAPGTYSKPQTVTISDTTSGVTIYYTTDGSFPTTSSTSCANPCTLTVSTSTIIKAIAAGSGISQSGVGVGNYIITGH